MVRRNCLWWGWFSQEAVRAEFWGLWAQVTSGKKGVVMCKIWKDFACAAETYKQLWLLSAFFAGYRSLKLCTLTQSFLEAFKRRNFWSYVFALVRQLIRAALAVLSNKLFMKWGGWGLFRGIIEEMPWAKFPSTWPHPKLSPKSLSLQLPNRKAGCSYRITSLWWFSQCAFQQTDSLPQDSHKPVFSTRDALLYSRTTPSSCYHESWGDPGNPRLSILPENTVEIRS